MFFGAMLFFSLVLNLVDLFMHIANYLQNNCSVKDIFLVMLYYIPKTLWYAVPVAMLFSVSYTLSDMYANNELEALFASGVSLFKFTYPVLLFSIVLSVGLFVFENNLVVQTYEKKQRLQDELLKKTTSANNTDVIVISDNGSIIYKTKKYTESTKKLQSVYFVFRDENKSVDAIIYSPSAVWDFNKQKWKLDSPTEYKRIDIDNKANFGNNRDDSQIFESQMNVLDTIYDTISIDEINPDKAEIFEKREKNKDLEPVDSGKQIEQSENFEQLEKKHFSMELVPTEKRLTDRLTESYEIFRKKVVDVPSVTAKEAKVYIAHLKKAGLPYHEQLSEYYKKFSFPFIVFLVVFLSIGLTGKTKKNVLLISLASCISATVLFYVFMMVTMILAKHGYVSPFMGAFSPVFFFVIVSGILLRYSRT